VVSVWDLHHHEYQDERTSWDRSTQIRVLRDAASESIGLGANLAAGAVAASISLLSAMKTPASPPANQTIPFH